MNPETVLSTHANKRLNQRVNMTPYELSVLLDHDLAILIGKNLKRNILYKLFYSTTDNDYFVAIQDITCGTVISIFHSHFKTNEYRKISKYLKNEAKQRVMNKDIANCCDQKPQGFRISFKIVNQYGEYQKVINVCKWPFSNNDSSVKTLIENDDFIAHIEQMISNVNNENSDRCYVDSVLIKIGKTDITSLKVR